MRIRALFALPAVALAFSCFFAGCDSDVSEAKPPTESASSPSLAQEVPVATNVFDSPVAVRVNGRDVMRQDIIRNGRMMLSLNMNKRRKTKVGRAERTYLRSYVKRAVPLAIGRAAVSAYLAEHGISASSNELERVGRIFSRRYGVHSKRLKRWHTIDDLKYMLGKIAPCLDAEILACANYDLATNAIIRAAKIEVTDQMAAERIAGIADYNRRIAVTNAQIFAKATNVWKQVVAKDFTFEAAAEKFSEDAYLSEGVDWGSFTKDQLADEPAVLALVPSLKVGDVTPPVESDGGLAILRRDENDNPDVISFSRIFFRLPMFCESESLAEAKAALKAEKEHAAVKQTLDGYAAKLKIEYPDGSNVMSRAISAKEFND